MNYLQGQYRCRNSLEQRLQNEHVQCLVCRFAPQYRPSSCIIRTDISINYKAVLTSIYDQCIYDPVLLLEVIFQDHHLYKTLLHI